MNALTVEELRRQLARVTGISPRRPDAPREVKFLAGAVRWTEPADKSPVTHYGVRIDHDGGEPDAVYPVGTRWVPVPQGTTAFVSSLNFVTGLESAKVAVSIAQEAIGNQKSLQIVLPEVTEESPAPTLVEFPAGQQDDLLVVAVHQNEAGDNGIEWGETFDQSTPVEISDEPDSITRFVFWWNNIVGLWQPLAQWPALTPGPVVIDEETLDVDEETDPMRSVITFEVAVPEVLNGFDGVEAFYEIGSEITPLGHLPLVTDPADPMPIRIDMPRPISDQTGRIRLVARNRDRVAPLVVAGEEEDQTPWIEVELTARPESEAIPPAALVTSVAGTVEYDDVDVPRGWRLATATIGLPVDRSTIMRVDIGIAVFTDGTFAEILQEIPLLALSVPPTGDIVLSELSFEFWQLPAFGERFLLYARSVNYINKPSADVLPKTKFMFRTFPAATSNDPNTYATAIIK